MHGISVTMFLELWLILSTDDTPTLQQLIELRVPEKGVSLRIMDKIGVGYFTLGTYLLNDEDGGTIRKIERDYKFTEKILEEVFHRWLTGQGLKGKNTWETLIKYLKHTKLMVLVDEIESVLQFCTEKTMHVDDDKECVHGHGHGGHIREAPVEALFVPQLLISITMLAPVIAVAAFRCCKSKLRIINY